MGFRITGLPPEPFRPLFGLSEAELARRGVRRYVADPSSRYPDRVEMRHAKPGETVLLLHHLHQPAETPYRAGYAIFVREGAEAAYDEKDNVPEVMRARLLSLRGYDAAGYLVDADVVEGSHVEPLIERLLSDERVAYLHAHNARHGCYSGRIDRAA